MSAPQQVRYASVGHRPGARVFEVHLLPGKTYGRRNSWAPEGWNGDLRFRFDEGDGRLSDTREAAEAALAERQAAYREARPEVRDFMDGYRD